MKKAVKEIVSILIALFLAFMALRLILFVFNVTIWAVFNLFMLIGLFIIALPLYIIAKKQLFK